MSINRALQNWLAWTACLFAVLVLLYILTAPPVILAHYHCTGDGGIPSFYEPLMDVAFSSFGAPIIWYFNSVWHSELMTIGETPEWSWYVMVAYGIVTIAFVAIILLPVIRLIRWRTHAA